MAGASRGGMDARAMAPSAPLRVACVLALMVTASLAQIAAPDSGLINPGIVLRLIKQNRYGATCLDGSAPGYYVSPGWGSGVNNWVFYLQGGAWCTSLRACAARAGTYLGSTKFWPAPADPDFNRKLHRLGTSFNGILSPSAVHNPSFYNWNRVMVFYCDGGGFAGNRTGVRFNASLALNFHGQKILQAVVLDLYGTRGLKSAQNVILTGCSAGAQGISMACDTLGNRFPRTARVKCVMDAGFFLNGADVTGDLYFQRQVQQLVALQNLRDGFDPDCLAAMPPAAQFKCFFPQYNLFYISRPVFIINSIADYAAIFILNEGRGAALAQSDVTCLSSGRMVFGNSTRPGNASAVCTPQQQTAIDEYQHALLNRINIVLKSKPSFGSFLTAYLNHCVTVYPTWTTLQRKQFKLVPALTKWFWS